MNKFQQIKNLETGKGIQYLLDAGYEIFSNPIVMFDTYYMLIAYTDVTTDDPVWNELISTGTFSMTEQAFFSSERFTEDVANADKLVVMKSEKLKYDRILGNVFNREHIKVANLVMVESLAPFETDTQTAFEALVDKITNEIRNDDHYTAYGREYHHTIITKILDREITDTKIYTGHVQILYDGFEDYLYVAVVDVTQNSAKGDDRLAYFRDLLKKRYPSFKFAVYSGYVLMIVSSKYDIFSSEGILGGHENPFDQNNLFTGISGSFENLYELEKYYNEAITALKNGIAGNSGGHVFLYNNA